MDGGPISMFTRLVGRQIMLVAGRNLLVERVVHFSDFLVNAPDFAPRARPRAATTTSCIATPTRGSATW